MTLLTNAEISSRKPVMLFGNEVSVNEGNLFLAMIRLIRPMHNPVNFSTLKKQVSQYKNCEISIRSDIPFHEEGYVRLLRERMSTDYYRFMEETYELLNAFLMINDPETKDSVAKQIVCSLKGVIFLDDTIPEDSLFPVRPDGGSLSKAELIECNRINFYSFIAGIFYYACANIPDNTVGAGTVRQLVLTKSRHGKKAVVRDDMGEAFTSGLEISFDLPVLPEDTENEILYAPILKEKQITVFSKYLESLYESRYKVPTLMYRNKLTPLYDFYVSPVLRIRDTDGVNEASQYITKPSPDRLLKYARHLLIVGDGGMGKSTVMLDLLLQAITDFRSTGILPIFSELKEFHMPCESLSKYLYENTEAWWDHSYRAFTVHLEHYQTIIFFDGFDEIKSRFRAGFSRLLHEFTARYPKAQVIISSRLVGNVISQLRLRSVSVEPFTCAQCIELIKKYQYRPDRPEIKASFIKALKDNDLYRRHRSIAENPLLCTMMLRIFGAEGRIPETITRFYEQAYQIMSADHDAAKAFERHLYTGLDPRDLKLVLEEICMYAYSDERYSFSVDEMGLYLSNLNAYEKLGISPLQPETLLTDLKDNLCLMVENESGSYSFIGNRYFDNYFSAVYMSRNLEGNSEYAIELFERGKYKRDGDHVLDMLYSLDRHATQIHLFLPKLQMIFNRIDEIWENHLAGTECLFFRQHDENKECIDVYKARFCCFSYLRECYDSISYTSGTVLYPAANYPVSPLLNFILELNQFHNELDTDDVENPHGYFTEEIFYEYMEDRKSDPRIVTVQDLWMMDESSRPNIIDGVPRYDPEEDDFRIEEVGRSYIIPPEQLNYDEYPEIIESLTNTYSPYFKEYRNLRDYYESLMQKQKSSVGNVFRRPSFPRTA